MLDKLGLQRAHYGSVPANFPCFFFATPLTPVTSRSAPEYHVPGGFVAVSAIADRGDPATAMAAASSSVRCVTAAINLQSG
jgi:hypothetical protein